MDFREGFKQFNTFRTDFKRIHYVQKFLVNSVNDDNKRTNTTDILWPLNVATCNENHWLGYCDSVPINVYSDGGWKLIKYPLYPSTSDFLLSIRTTGGCVQRCSVESEQCTGCTGRIDNSDDVHYEDLVSVSYRGPSILNRSDQTSWKWQTPTTSIHIMYNIYSGVWNYCR